VSAEPAVSRVSVECLLRPRSIAIIGVSADAASMGGRSLANLDRFAFAGGLHLVSRTNDRVGARDCVRAIDDLPDGIDAAIIALPARAVLDAVHACARRGIKGLVVYAAGFAEGGEAGREEQDRITAAARAADIALLGPNTLGLTNYVDGVLLAFGPNAPNPVGGRPALAVIAQSGAMMGSMRLSAAARQLAVSYAIATGNEAVTGVEDYLACLVDDPATHAIAIFAEQLRRPLRFLELARIARLNDKPIILLHPGRSQRARDSAASHTGAMTGDYATMRALVASEAVIAVETLEEFLDAAELLTRFPRPAPSGPAIMTDSGAFRGLALDMAEAIGLPLPGLTDATTQALAERLPDFASGSNPLDITAQGLKDMPLYAEATRLLLADAGCGSLLISVMPGSPQVGRIKAETVLPVLADIGKPCAYVIMGGAAPVDPGLEPLFLARNNPFFRSPERALRGLAHLTRYASLKQGAALPRAPAADRAGTTLPPGMLAEYRGKALLAAAGLCVPDGDLARSPEQAVAIAARIGFPVVAKVQSPALPHKTEVGGVIVGIDSAAALRSAWTELHDRVARHRPGLALDGILVEAMGPRGLEMVVGGRRDAAWGPVVLFGLGGIWTEALADVRLIPADLGAAGIIAELRQLKAWALLDGFRGAAGIDLDALADAIMGIGGLLRRHPDIEEIDVNPLIAYPRGRAPLALDALVVVADRRQAA
jgi:acyl-CoA synthetase (NDP forming)